jgi:multiple sugar transport system ATP-binding protein
MQRVSIARAIVREPAVLIMDEPISHLDAGLRARLRDELKTQVAELGVTTLYITHDQVESMAMANRIAVMNLGMIQQVGSPLEIYYNPRNEFVAGFIGEPPMNFSAGELVQEAELVLVSASFKIVLGSEARLRLRTHQGSARLNVGVRPEDFHLSDSEEPNTFPAEVDFVERQGDRAIITLKSKSGEIFLAQSMEDFRPAAGRTVHVSIDQRHMHFFDPETGLNVLQSQGRKT